MRSKGMMVLTVGAGLLAGGCATKTYVREEVGRETAAVHTRVDTVQGQLEATQTKVREHDEKIAAVSRTAQEALQRAQEAGKLAEGKLLYETVLSDDKVRFGFDKYSISDEAKAALDTFATPIVGGNENVYIEIQGHTDSVGQRRVQRGARPRARGGHAALPQHPAQDPAAPHQRDLLRRVGAGRRQQEPRGPRSEPARRAGGPEVGAPEYGIDGPPRAP